MFNIKQEIEEITNESLFLAFHERKGHCITEHLLSDRELQNKLWDMPKPSSEEDIVMATRFFSKEQALKDIQTALYIHQKEIENWRKNLLYPFLELQVTLPNASGEGICKNADRKKLIPVHGIRLILIANDKEGRAFYIKTAYPVRTFDDIDEIYDAIDEWQQRKNKFV